MRLKASWKSRWADGHAGCAGTKDVPRPARQEPNPLMCTHSAWAAAAATAHQDGSAGLIQLWQHHLGNLPPQRRLPRRLWQGGMRQIADIGWLEVAHVPPHFSHAVLDNLNLVHAGGIKPCRLSGQVTDTQLRLPLPEVVELQAGGSRGRAGRAGNSGACARLHSLLYGGGCTTLNCSQTAVHSCLQLPGKQAPLSRSALSPAPLALALRQPWP